MAVSHGLISTSCCHDTRCQLDSLLNVEALHGAVDSDCRTAEVLHLSAELYLPSP